MSKVSNEYIELKKDGSLQNQFAEKRNEGQLHSAFSNINGYEYISKNQVMLNGERTVISRLVPEGNKGSMMRKRVQISSKSIDRLPDKIIIAYINDGNIFFIETTAIDALIDLPPKNPTTLFRMDIRDLKQCLEHGSYMIENVVSRGFKTTLKITTDINELFDGTTFAQRDTLLGSMESEEDFDAIVIYDSPSEVEDFEDTEDTRAEIGRLSEQIVYDALISSDNLIKDAIETDLGVPIESVDWVNQSKESFKPYDMIVNMDIFIEVKGSSSSGTFMYSVNEYEQCKSNQNNYLLIKLNGVNINEKSFDNFSTYLPEQIFEFDMKPLSYIVKENNG